MVQAQNINNAACQTFDSAPLKPQIFAYPTSWKLVTILPTCQSHYRQNSNIFKLDQLCLWTGLDNLTPPDKSRAKPPSNCSSELLRASS